ncbi:MAG: hypothetical protein GY869_27260, partial [Planctomycetes bacterium]|nr:hypothetical protein [Planctomycetota bacterium]
LGINIAANAALANKRVLLITLEDTRLFVQWRLLSRFGEIPLENLVKRQLTPIDVQNIEKAEKIIRCFRLWIVDTSAVSSEQIRYMCSSYVDKYNLDLIIIDHLGQINEPGANLYESTTSAARNIAQIPKDLNVPVLLLHQLNREVEKRPDKLPILSDLRQSGEIEQLARVVWLLHRPSYYDKNAIDKREMLLNVAKNSHGPTGKTKLDADLKYMFITSAERDY